MTNLAHSAVTIELTYVIPLDHFDISCKDLSIIVKELSGFCSMTYLNELQ